MIIQSWNIFWNDFAQGTFLNGAQIEYKSKNEVVYENPLMPSGSVIKEWLSRTNYQKHKTEPALPLIDGEGKYQLLFQVDCEAGEQCLFRLVFFNRFDQEVGNVSIWQSGEYFQCPLTTYSYKLQLINSGLSKIVFHSVTIREVSDDTEE